MLPNVRLFRYIEIIRHHITDILDISAALKPVSSLIEGGKKFFMACISIIGIPPSALLPSA
jgi:hypothetical protein